MSRQGARRQVDHDAPRPAPPESRGVVIDLDKARRELGDNSLSTLQLAAVRRARRARRARAMATYRA